jgi:hypothetical protein
MSTSSSPYDTRGGDVTDDGLGWKLFAGIMILIGGTFNVLDGLVGVTDAHQVENTLNRELPLTDNVKTWSWVVLIVGIIMIIAGFLIFVGNTFGRVVGVFVASVNAILQLGYLAHFPLWSFTMIVVDILVIWALVVHGGKLWDTDTA